MAKLPADLPENWTSGQIISPNGTEVGLDAKHGYNYLMKQVNAAQSGVNTLNDNMTGVAQESTLQGVKTDVETLSTSAAKEATLQTVKTNVAQVQTDVTDLSQNFNDLTSIWQHTDTTVDTVASRVGTTTDTNGSQTTGTVMGKLNAVQGQVGQLNFTDGPVNVSNEVVILEDTETHTTSSATAVLINQIVVPSDVDGGVRVKATMKSDNQNYSAMLLVSNSPTTPTISSGNIGYLSTTKTTMTEDEIFVSAAPGQTLYFWIMKSGYATLTLSNLTVSYVTPNEAVQTINTQSHTGQSYTSIGQVTIPSDVNGLVRFKTTLNSSSYDYESYFLITDSTTSVSTSTALGVAKMKGTTPTEVYIDINVLPGQVIYFFTYSYSYNNTVTQSTITMSYNTSKLVCARMFQYPIVLQGYQNISTPNSTSGDSAVGERYYHSVTLGAKVSQNNFVLFMPATSSAIGSNWYNMGFGRVVNGNELRLYQPGSSNSSFGGYWYVIDFGGAN